MNNNLNSLFNNLKKFEKNLNNENRKRLFGSPPKRVTPPKKEANSWESDYEHQNYAMLYQNEYNNAGQLIMRELPTQELAHVFTFTRLVYYEIYPEKSGETPYHWTNTIIDLYKNIRYEKAKRELNIQKPKSQLTKEENMAIFLKTRSVLKGLQFHEIVGGLIYCYLIANNIPIPQSVLIILMNKALLRMKETKVPFTLESFEKYRKIPEIKEILYKLRPECYRTKNVPPEKYIRLMSNVYLKIEPRLILCAERVARRMQQLRKNGFTQLMTSDLRAIACVAAVCHAKNIHFSATTFGLKEMQYKKALNIVLNNNDDEIKRHLECK